MPEFQLIRRQDVPNAWKIGSREPDGPKARLHRGGCLYFSVQAAAALGTQDCMVIAEFNKPKRTLKFTAMDTLPDGITEDDCFPLRIRVTGPHNRRAIGMVSIRALLNHIGFWQSGPVDFPIVAMDEKNRSVTLVLPCAP